MSGDSAELALKGASTAISCGHTATFRVMQVCLIQVRPYAIRCTTARAVSINVYYSNQSTQRASECRLNNPSCIYGSIHRIGRVQGTPVTISSHSSVPVHKVSETLTLNSSTAIPGFASQVPKARQTVHATDRIRDIANLIPVARIHACMCVVCWVITNFNSLSPSQQCCWSRSRYQS